MPQAIISLKQIGSSDSQHIGSRRLAVLDPRLRTKVYGQQFSESAAVRVTSKIEDWPRCLRGSFSSKFQVSGL